MDPYIWRWSGCCLVLPWNPKLPFINGCLVISNHFLYKDLGSSSNWWPTIYKWLALGFQVSFLLDLGSCDFVTYWPRNYRFLVRQVCIMPGSIVEASRFERPKERPKKALNWLFDLTTIRQGSLNYPFWGDPKIMASFFEDFPYDWSVARLGWMSYICTLVHNDPC